MTPKEFIISKIGELVNQFPNTRCRYENHFISNSHIIEVVPNEIYRLDGAFQVWEEETVFEFMANFPNQTLSFISDDAIVGIDNIDFEAKGILFDLLYSINTENYQTVKVTNIHSINSSPLITQINVGNSSFVISDKFKSSFTTTKRYNSIGIVTGRNTGISEIEIAGNSNIAIAA
jgi:hypothetical protein